MTDFNKFACLTEDGSVETKESEIALGSEVR